MRVGVNTVENQRLDVAVENDSDKFAGFVDYRAAAVAADDVRVGDEIETSRQI